MPLAGLPDQVTQALLSPVALQHSIGEQNQPVALTQVEALHAVPRVRGNAEGQVDQGSNLLDLPAAQAQRPDVAGVDEGGLAGVETDAQQLTGGHDLATVLHDGLTYLLRMVGERLMRSVRVGRNSLMGILGLVEEAAARPAGIAKGSDDHGRQQCCLYVVPHGISEGQVQCVTVERVVEGVPADVGSWFQRSRDDEPAGVAGEGVRK